MAIDKKELTEEQKKAVWKLYKKYLIGGVAVAVLYGWFTFFGILAIVVLNKLYLHSKEFQGFCSFGTGFIASCGLFATMQERRAELSSKILEIINK